MIVPSQTCEYLQKQLPEISKVIPPNANLFISLHELSELSCKSAATQDYGKLARCFDTAATLYEEGNATVKSAVENVFVYSFSRLFVVAVSTRKEVKSLIPPILLNLYMLQVLHHGY